ncbi:DNA binding domain-containing protein, excisionase family [Acetomicrobium thermoterrenum DSM 13490]|uniref:DNA binding domain, excisionase family n=2 Tax=Acetomicrobium TaxID=49894 RepID=A0A0T5XA44_9BACT|nr:MULTISPECIES: helix-turn-helix domain-containing protein [Acetomicrobium]KRT35219.1 DNA binding domain, excisionase family [Acetomicrobium hydrogeniformans ATCC BAA-1850]SDX97921.1 DNA binding domain-containing protein, excisionase family [Acetomicrobium thermoterrenum DSM 13490]
MEKLLTPKDAAEILSLSPVTIKKWLWQGKLKGIKVGSVWRIRESDLKAFLKTSNDDEEKLSRDDLEAVKRGLEDIKAGRYVTLKEYEQDKRL